MSRIIPPNTIIIDPVTGQQAQVESNSALAVNIQDQHSPAFDSPFAAVVGAPTTLTIDAVLDAWSISVTTGHGLVANDIVLLQDLVSGRAMQAGVVSIAGNNTVNLDTPVNFAYTSANTTVIEITTSLNVNGSVARQSFFFGTGAAGLEIDVVRIMFQITTATAPLITDFGDIAGGLARGLILRSTNSVYTNLWNVKTNAELALLMYDVQVYEADKSFQATGLAGRLTYGGSSKHGVTLRLVPGELLELIVQDDLTDLLTFKMSAAGHVVTE